MSIIYKKSVDPMKINANLPFDFFVKENVKGPDG